MAATAMEVSHTSASNASNTPNSIFSSTLQAVWNAMFKSQFPDSIEASSSTGSRSAASNDTFFSMPNGSEHDESTPQDLIDIIDAIIGPIQESGQLMPDGDSASVSHYDPVPRPPPSPPQTPPPFWLRAVRHRKSGQDQSCVWDMISDEEEVKEDEWERL